MDVMPTRAVLALLLLFTTSVQAATTAQLDNARNRGLAWLFTHQSSEGQWESPGGLPVQTTAAAIDALKNAGITQGYFYAGAVAWLRNAEALSTDALARQIGTLSTTGMNTQALVTTLLANRTDTSKAWGALPKYQGSFPDTALALDAILLTNTSYADTATTVTYITGKQNTDGGWAYGASAPVALQSQIIPTAHNILALSRAKLAGQNVDTYLTKAVNWMVARKKTDNGFAEDSAATTGSVYETALVYVALAKAKQASNATAVAAQITLDGAQDFLVNIQSIDGNWNNDALAAALALQALPTVALIDADKDGIPDSVEPFLGTNAALPDGRQWVIGNGDSQLGTTVPVVIGSSEVGKALSFTLTGGGTGPFTWSLVSGALPTGTTLNSSTGVISGTPTISGTFNFTYQVKNSQGMVISTAGQIIALGSASSITPDFTVFITGSSAQQASVGSVFASLCQAGTVDVYYDTATSGVNHRAYSCTLKTTLGDPLINGKKLLLSHRAQGDSISGVTPIARAESIARMVVDSTCVATGNIYPVVPQYKCPSTVSAIPDVGVSDVEPGLFQGVNLPQGVNALTNKQQSFLTRLSAQALVFGVATTNNVNTVQPNLSREQVTSLAVGAYQDWGSANAVLTGKPVIMCLGTSGSGAKAVMNAYFGGFPCLSNAGWVLSDYTVNNVTNGTQYTVIESSSPAAISGCMNAAYNGGAYTDAYGTMFNLPAGSAAMAVLPLTTQPVASDKWKFSSLDGTPATVLNAATLGYDLYAEPYILYRNTDLCIGGTDAPHPTPCHAGETTVAKLSTVQSAFLTKFVAAAGDPAVMSNLPGVAALASNYDPNGYTAGQVMRKTRQGNTCSPSVLYY